MKKVLYFLTIALMMGSVLVSCKKDNNTKKSSDTGEETVYTPAVTIDGNTSEWSSLSTTKATIPSNSTYNTLTSMDVYADEYFVFVRLQGVTNATTKIQGEEFTGDYTKFLPLDIFINADGKDETGAAYWAWTVAGGAPAGVNYMLQSAAFISEGAVGDLSDIGMFEYGGEDGTDEWNWVDTGVTGFAKAAGTVSANKFDIELSLLRAQVDGLRGTNIRLGFLVECDEWQVVGMLPQGEPTVEDSADYTGNVAMLSVTLPELGK